jgi:hypothetical protein
VRGSLSPGCYVLADPGALKVPAVIGCCVYLKKAQEEKCSIDFPQDPTICIKNSSNFEKQFQV